MIVNILGLAPAGAESAYLALRSTEAGDWTPITGDPVATVDEAIRICITHASDQLDDLERRVARYIDVAQEHLARLFDRPTPEDRIFIRGDHCTVAPDGTLTLTPPPDPEPDDELLEESTVATMLSLVRGELTPDQAGELIDLATNEPLRLLAAIADHAPDLLAEAAAFLVAAYRGELG